MSVSNYYSEEGHGPHEYFELGDFEFDSGITLPNAKLAFKTQGTLNAAKDNVILFPHMWSGTSKSMEIFIGEDRPINPKKFFIILPGQFANGFSSSPSNTPPPFYRAVFPNVTVYDNVVCQHRLMTERFDIKRIKLVLGFSMSAQQAYQWAASYPTWWKPSPRSAAQRARLRITFSFSKASRRRSRQMPRSPRAGIRPRRLKDCVPSPGCIWAGASPKISSANMNTARWAWPRWKIACGFWKDIFGGTMPTIS